jgi:hypothetical protein
MTTAVAEDRLVALEAKLDAISHQLEYVAAHLREQDVRRGMWDELRRDLAPVTAEALDRVSQELDEVRSFVAPSGLLRMFKRVLRDLPYLEALLDQVESLSQLGADLSPLGREVLVAAMAGLADLEQKGYFSFAKGAKGLVDQVVGALGEQDLRELRDSVGPAVQALKDLAHPEVMRLVQSVAAELRQPRARDEGLLRLLWRLRRPQTRRGLARALALVETLGTAPGEAVASAPTDIR